MQGLFLPRPSCFYLSGATSVESRWKRPTRSRLLQGRKCMSFRISRLRGNSLTFTCRKEHLGAGKARVGESEICIPSENTLPAGVALGAIGLGWRAMRSARGFMLLFAVIQESVGAGSVGRSRCRAVGSQDRVVAWLRHPFDVLSFSSRGGVPRIQLCGCKWLQY